MPPMKKSKSPSKAVKTTAARAKPAGMVKANKSDPQASGAAASRLIDQRISDLGGWRGDLLARVRALILEADPGIVEEWKWGTPVWSRDGIVCTGETYKDYVKTTFAKGASLKDPSRLFNAADTGATRRAINFREGGKFDEKAFKTLVRAAVTLNASKPTKAAGAKKKA